MGKLLLYGAGRAIQSYACGLPSTTGGYQTNSYKDTSGNSYSSIWIWIKSYNTSSATNTANKVIEQLKWLDGLTGACSADTEADFDLVDYTTNAIADVSVSQSNLATVNGRIYTVTATNNGASDVSVGSIKFTKGIYAPAGETDSPTAQTCLICGYFLDNPVTLGVGETKTFAVNFDCWNY